MPPQGAMTPPGGPPQKKGGGAKVAIIAVVVLVLLGGVGAGAFFLLGGKKSSVAHEHLPSGCAAVVRVDVDGIRDVEAVKEHIMPALEKASAEGEDSGKLAKVLVAAALDPRKDIHSVAICVHDLPVGGEPDVVVIVGGKFKANGLIESLKANEKDLDDFEIEDESEKDGLIILEEKNGAFITQASDAAIVFGNDEDLVVEAAKATDDFKDYELPLEHHVELVVTEDAVHDAAKKGAGLNPAAKGLADAGRVLLTGSLDSGEMKAEVDLGDDDAADEMAKALEQFMKLGGGSAPKDVKGILDNTEFEADGSVLTIKTEIPAKTIEKACEEIAEGIEEANED